MFLVMVKKGRCARSAAGECGEIDSVFLRGSDA